MHQIVAILAVFGMPVAIVFLSKYFKLREKQLEAARHGDPRKLEALEQERKLLVERVQNLESIVCSVDFELNQRLNRLAAGASQAMAALPAPSTVTAPAGASAGLAAATGATTLAAGPAASTGLPPTVTVPSPGSLPDPLSATTPAGLNRPSPDSEARLGYRLGVLVPGQVVLGRYQIEREIGRGGMGAVYLARDATLGEPVALKVISSVKAEDPATVVARFHREVQAARRVTHANVIRIHDIGEDGPLLFLSMEFVDGETLAARLRRVGKLPLAEAVSLLGAIAEGVAAAHQAGVVHRDLKPQNVLLGAQGRVKVIDFGLATSTFLAGMTATGLILGTPEYMAPEQLRGAPCDARTDVYALGVIAYQALCGRPPFVGETPIAVGFGHLSQEPPPPRELRPDLTPSLERALASALAKDPAKRLTDAAAFRAALSG